MGSAVEVYDKSAIFLGPDIVPPLMSKVTYNGCDMLVRR